MDKNSLSEIIEKAWLEKDINLEYYRSAIREVINALDLGTIRVANLEQKKWQINDWIKKAILLSFKLNNSEIIEHNIFNYYDKIDLKFSKWNSDDFQKNAIRAVPGSIVRHGSYIGKNCILMPSFVNIGAFIDDRTLIDAWATVGSCAQIGKNCHISGGTGIGGVLEPLQALPVIIEDDCFIGARSEVAEGVIVGQGSVIAMGVFLSQSTKIYNRLTKKISYGYIPPYSVVIPGSIESFDKTHSTYAAIIVKQVDQETRKKTAINELLRD